MPTTITINLNLTVTLAGSVGVSTVAPDFARHPPSLSEAMQRQQNLDYLRRTLGPLFVPPWC